MKITDLVNKVEDFRFEFDGEVLTGKYYKYKTTTPNYAKETLEAIPPELTEGTDEEKAEAEKKRDEAIGRRGLKVIADTIIEWDALDDNGNPVPLSLELFEQLPNPFTEKFLDFFHKLRQGNPTNGNGSQPGSQTQPIPN